MASEIRNEALWESGAAKIEWVKRNMPLLNGIEKEFETAAADHQRDMGDGCTICLRRSC